VFIVSPARHRIVWLSVNSGQRTNQRYQSATRHRLAGLVSFGTQRTGSSNGFAIVWGIPQPCCAPLLGVEIKVG
jgi:hypothetical protein